MYPNEKLPNILGQKKRGRKTFEQGNKEGTNERSDITKKIHLNYLY